MSQCQNGILTFLGKLPPHLKKTDQPQTTFRAPRSPNNQYSIISIINHQFPAPTRHFHASKMLTPRTSLTLRTFTKPALYLAVPPNAKFFSEPLFHPSEPNLSHSSKPHIPSPCPPCLCGKSPIPYRPRKRCYNDFWGNHFLVPLGMQPNREFLHFIDLSISISTQPRHLPFFTSGSGSRSERPLPGNHFGTASRSEIPRRPASSEIFSRNTWLCEVWPNAGKLRLDAKDRDSSISDWVIHHG
jgi:hypothetical protein